MKNKSGFTLLEILVVLSILALLVVIAVPSYIKTQREVERITCISNLKQIEEALERFAASAKLSPGDTVCFSDIVPDFIKLRPQCPSQGTYSLNTIGEKPTCSIEGHEIP